MIVNSLNLPLFYVFLNRKRDVKMSSKIIELIVFGSFFALDVIYAESPKDGDSCLRAAGWVTGTCSSSTEYCTKTNRYGDDMRRCCPESCNTGQDYEPCFINTTKSCTERNNADTGKRMDYDACVAFCNQDPECKFIFHVPKNQDIPSGISCIKSRSCDETTKTNFVGSTYSREGDCPDVSYTPCYLNLNVICKAKYHLDMQGNLNRTECEAKCNGYEGCQFIFYSATSKNCILFQNCDEIQRHIEVGSIYSNSECLDGWIIPDVGQYKLVETSDLCTNKEQCTWMESKDVCSEQDNGYLARISSEKENSRILDVLNEKGMIEKKYHFFIGLKKNGSDLIWYNGERKLGYDNFKPGSHWGTNNTKCAFMNGAKGNKGKWQHVKCFELGDGWSEKKFVSLCEKDITGGFWKKKDKHFCPTCKHPYRTMMEAIIRLKNVSGQVIYDMFCDGVGLFCTCSEDQNAEDRYKPQDHPRGIDCIYEKIESRRKRIRTSKEEL